MKRVPLSAKPTISLQDIIEQDAVAEIAQPSEIGYPIPEIEHLISDIGNMKSDNGSQIPDIDIPKSDIGYPIADSGFPKSPEGPATVAEVNPNMLGNQFSEIGNPKGDKSDYEKVTATLEPKLFWLLEDEKRRRRIAKLDYSFSEIIREALTEYFIKQGRDIN